MKSAVLFSTLIALASADVRVYTDTRCMATERLVTTKAGQCISINAGAYPYSAGGCSVGHNLRIYTDELCGSTHQDAAPQACINLGGNPIKSFMCLK